MRLFIKTGTRDELIQKANEGGGFVQAEILVTNNFELAVPEPERKYWIDLPLVLRGLSSEKKDTVEIGEQ